MSIATLIRSTAVIIAALSLVLVAGVASAQQSGTLSGTIRGGIYEDVNGDGRCTDTEFKRRRPVSGINLHFTTGGASLRLYSGSNGTYGLIPVTPSVWQVRVVPDPNTWLVTSANPLQVEVTAGEGAVQTGVDFCLLRISGPSLTSLPVDAGPVIGAAVTGEPGSEPPSPSEQQEQSDSTAVDQELSPLEEKAIISRALLSNPPQPRPPENIEETLETPVDADATPVAEWLSYLNRFRQMGGLAQLTESESLTYGSQWHSRYMVVNDTPIAHSEEQGNVLYDPAGHQAARNGNIFATTQFEADHTWAMNFWISAPFHLVPILDPGLGEVGYGQHNQEVGNFHMAAVLDVRSALGDATAGVEYPLYFPGEGESTWVVRHSLYEWPDAMSSCAGYSRPSGPPLVLQLGAGDLTPNVSSHAVYEDDQLIESCHFDESSYSNPDAYAQSVGRVILDERDAVVVIPRQPLGVGKTYRVEVTADGELYTWQFSTQGAP